MGYMIDSDILLDLIHSELITFLSTLNIMIPEDRRQHFEIAIGGIINRAGGLTDAEAHDARGPWINIDDVKRDLNATCFARREESGELIALESLEMYAEMRGRPSVLPDVTKYEYHYDHTDCIWYRPEARNRCPTTCAQYRDGWNDAMNYIFRDGKGYRPYRRDKQYEE